MGGCIAMTKASSRSMPFSAALRDGTTVLIREIGPQDRCLLSDGFAHVSEQSRFMRFLGHHADLTPAELDEYTRPNDADHFAIGARTETTPLATARYIRLGTGSAAEMAITLVDEAQGRGLGGLMMRTLIDAALERGVDQFVALVHRRNQPMLKLLHRFGAVTVVSCDTEHELRLDLTAEAPQ